jgi:hypothetical protein
MQKEDNYNYYSLQIQVYLKISEIKLKRNAKMFGSLTILRQQILTLSSFLMRRYTVTIKEQIRKEYQLQM